MGHKSVVRQGRALSLEGLRLRNSGQRLESRISVGVTGTGLQKQLPIQCLCEGRQGWGCPERLLFKASLWDKRNPPRDKAGRDTALCVNEKEARPSGPDPTQTHQLRRPGVDSRFPGAGAPDARAQDTGAVLSPR